MATMQGQFAQVTKEQLVNLGEAFGTDLSMDMTRKEMLAQLETDGVTYQMYLNMLAEAKAASDAAEEAERLERDEADAEEARKALEAEMLAAATAAVESEEEDLSDPEEDVEEDNEPQPSVQLVRMTRKNFTYEVRGYKFSQNHPYALVDEEDADFLIEKLGGFRPATNKEIREFYGE